MKVKKFIAAVAAVSLLSLSFTPAQAADPYPKREVRGVWVAALGIDWPVSSGSRGTTTTAENKAKAEARQYLDVLQNAGINCVYYHVRPTSDRCYKKTTYNGETIYEPFCGNISGTRGSETTYDPLEFWIEECHARGMELHAWVNPYRYFNTTQSTMPSLSYRPSSYNTSFDNSISSQGVFIHYGQNPGNGNSFTTKYVYNPALESTKERIEKTCRVIVGNYDVDGVIFDDYFYCDGIPENSSADDWSNYQSYKNGGGKLSIGDWRRENVNDMVRRVNKAIHAVKPWVKFGISPAGAASHGVKASDGLPALSEYCSASDWQYSTIYSDPVAWLREQTVDYISPQLYWKTNHTTNPFGPLAQWWSIAAEKFGRHFYASHSISFLNGANVATNHIEVSDQVKKNRSANRDGALGSVFYSACNMDGAKNSGLGDVLKQQVFQHPAATPAITWYPAADPGLITGLRRSGSTLSWTAMSNMRYIAYAIPESVKPAEAVSSQGGYRAEYIIAVTYKNSATIPSGKTSGYWYAVAPLDRYGNEWPATTLGNVPVDITESLPAPVIFAPAEDEIVSSDICFVASPVEHMKQLVLDISTREDFSTIYYTAGSGWNPVPDDKGKEWWQLTVPVTTFGNGQYFWRVRAVNKEEYLDGVSNVRTFTVTGQMGSASDYVPEREDATYPAAANGTLVLSNLWTCKTGEIMDIELHRDMAVSHVSGSDILYVVGRSDKETNASTFLRRFDAYTGEPLPTLQLSYDNSFVKALYPGNGIITDAAGNLFTHNLALANGKVSLAQVNPATGACSTITTFSNTYRVDHLSILGTASKTSTFFVFAACPTSGNGDTMISKWKVVNGTATLIGSFTLGNFKGAAARVYPVSESLVWVDGPKNHPQLFSLSGTGAKLVSEVPSSVSSDTNGAGVTVFERNGQHYMICPVASFKTSYQWGIFSLDNYAAGASGLTELWRVPANGMGSAQMTSADWGTPVAVLQRNNAGDVQVQSVDNPSATSIFVYSPGNGISAYSLTSRIVTGADDIEIIEPEAAPEFYNLQGIRLNGDNLAPGIYVRRTGSKSELIRVTK